VKLVPLNRNGEAVGSVRIWFS